MTTYQYNVFGDLFRTVLPRGNVIEYGYDAAGRLVSDRAQAGRRHEERAHLLHPRHLRTSHQRRDSSAGMARPGSPNPSPIPSTAPAAISTRPSTPTARPPNTPTTATAILKRSGTPTTPGLTNPTPTQLYAYDSLNRLISVTQPWTGPGGSTAVTTYGYDVQDHLTSVTDAEGNTTTYTYSDRDLMTQEVSPVSGTTTHAYNEHGEMVSETDARGITMTREVDELDRVTLIDYPDNSLDTTYAYGSNPAHFNVGRLTSITRNGQAISYAYDRFGRITQDGALGYQFDDNGNRTHIEYPGGVTAIYTHDFADRESTLSYDAGSGLQPLVTASVYKPFGPLTSLSLGNGLTETHAFNARYLPTAISVPGRLSWTYSTDNVGNPTSITDNLNAANNRTYAYQDHQYFLTTGNGPWGTRSWSYDKIGNRLTETRGGTTDTYSYLANGTGGHSPKIDRIVRGGGSTVIYDHDDVGNVLENGTLPFSYGDDRRLSQFGTSTPDTAFTYDGRGFLSQAIFTPFGGGQTDDTLPTYSSDGLLLHRYAHQSLQPHTRLSPVRDSDLYVFYFAGRPVATLDNVTEGTTIGGFTTTSTLHYLTVDHLGTPILVTDTAGAPGLAGRLRAVWGRLQCCTDRAALPRAVVRWDVECQEGPWAVLQRSPVVDGQYKLVFTR